MCLFVIRTSSSIKSQLKFFSHILIALFVFLLLNFKVSLYIVGASICQIYDLQVFSPSQWLTFLPS